MRSSEPNARPALFARLDLDDGALAELARRVAKLLEDAEPAEPASPYRDVGEAALYLRASKQRIYDLVNAGALTPRRDGRRLLFRVDTLDEYLAGQNGGDR